MEKVCARGSFFEYIWAKEQVGMVKTSSNRDSRNFIVGG
jgi:hypothetical protein